MVSFRSCKDQAQYAARKTRNEGRAKSLSTMHRYAQCLTGFAQHMKQLGLDLKSAKLEHALTYLADRAEIVGQSQLDQDRQAIESYLNVKIRRIKAAFKSTELAERARAYTPEQTALVREFISRKHRFSAALAEAAGLRAHELFTLQPTDAQSPSQGRPWRSDRFAGRLGETYTVGGKGGLIREVLLPSQMAAKLEREYRLKQPRRVTDRRIYYQQHYALTGGQCLSQAWTSASNRVFRWSNGLHGLRHQYAQARMDELKKLEYTHGDAKEIVSQELGHFRPDITDTYLR